MRLVVIGDPHGCLDELRDLLELLSLSEEDFVACVGDFVTKGPRPLECLELWRDKGWHAVLGNNDGAVLKVIRGEWTEAKEGLEQDARRLEARPDLVEYLESLPLSIDLPAHDAAVVHGGLLPHERFGNGVGEEVLLTLREIVEEAGQWRPAQSTDPREARRFWADVWDGDRFVVYGHTPRPDVAVHPRALGIDTGCVYGWRLTSAIRSEEGTWSTESVPARRVWAER